MKETKKPVNYQSINHSIKRYLIAMLSSAHYDGQHIVQINY